MDAPVTPTMAKRPPSVIVINNSVENLAHLSHKEGPIENQAFPQVTSKSMEIR